MISMIEVNLIHWYSSTKKTPEFGVKFEILNDIKRHLHAFHNCSVSLSTVRDYILDLRITLKRSGLIPA